MLKHVACQPLQQGAISISLSFQNNYVQVHFNLTSQEEILRLREQMCQAYRKMGEEETKH